MANISHFTQTVNGVSTTYDIHDANAIPRSGGAVMSGDGLYRDVDTETLHVGGGTGWSQGGTIVLRGKSHPNEKGKISIQCHSSVGERFMDLSPDGTWTWNGTACQITSDQRLKQQIAEIDTLLVKNTALIFHSMAYTAMRNIRKRQKRLKSSKQTEQRQKKRKLSVKQASITH